MPGEPHPLSWLPVAAALPGGSSVGRAQLHKEGGCSRPSLRGARGGILGCKGWGGERLRWGAQAAAGWALPQKPRPPRVTDQPRARGDAAAVHHFGQRCCVVLRVAHGASPLQEGAGGFGAGQWVSCMPGQTQRGQREHSGAAGRGSARVGGLSCGQGAPASRPAPACRGHLSGLCWSQGCSWELAT